MGIIKSSLQKPNDEFKCGKEQYPTLFPFNNALIEEYCQNYQLSAREITRLYEYFCETDSNNIGYIFFNDLCYFIEETEDSMMIPYLETFYKIINKKHEDRLNFLEWYFLNI